MPDATTPMMRQYYSIKQQYPDCLLFFRLGDFYEMFQDDAKVGARELDLTLTTRDRNKPEAERTPMCGVPYHSADAYIARLIAKGYKVAICEQMEDPATAKGIVERDIIRIVTPGTVIDSSMLDEGRNNYICAIYLDGEKPLEGEGLPDIGGAGAVRCCKEGVGVFPAQRIGQCLCKQQLTDLRLPGAGGGEDAGNGQDAATGVLPDIIGEPGAAETLEKSAGIQALHGHKSQCRRFFGPLQGENHVPLAFHPLQQLAGELFAVRKMLVEVAGQVAVHAGIDLEE